MKRNSLTRFTRTPLISDPFFRNLDRFFSDDVFRPFGSVAREGLEASGWLPAVDIRETDDTFEFIAELPGLSKDDVNITVEDKVLSVSGERTWRDEEEKNSYHRIERAYGSFSRSFTLPNAVDAAKVAARFDNGVLTITVPKAEETKPRQIEIS
jgi:HSP20 family protein